MQPAPKWPDVSALPSWLAALRAIYLGVRIAQVPRGEPTAHAAPEPPGGRAGAAGDAQAAQRAGGALSGLLDLGLLCGARL